MDSIKNFVLSEYQDKPIYYQRKAFYTFAFAMMLLVFILFASIIDIVVNRFDVLKAIEYAVYFLGIILCYFFFQFGHLETTTNILVVMGIIRLLAAGFIDQSVYQLLVITMISLLATAVIHIKRYQIYIVFGFYILLYCFVTVSIFGDYSSGIISLNDVGDRVYGLIAMLLYITMCWFLIRIIENEINRSAELEAARMTSVFYFEELEKLSSKLEDMAITDKLTGIYNRRKFSDIMEAEIDKCNRYHIPLALLMIDIDHFKKINDNYGHNIGDQVLVDLVREISANLRRTDSFFRWGGEEFIIIMTECDISMAISLADKIRKCVEAYEFNEVGHVTISIGAVSYDEGEAVNELIKRLDKNMYIAKESGRNQVIG